MKHALPCSLVLLLVSALPATAQVAYIADIKGAGWDIINDMVIDANGNTIIAGSIEGTCDFDPSAGVYNRTSNGMRDGFIAKYDENGTLLWAGSFGGSEADLVHSVAVDANGDIAIYGWIEGTADLDPTAGVQSTTSAGFRDGCVVKLDANGNLLWAFTLTNTTQCYGGDIDFSPLNGDVLVTGYFQTSIDLDPNGTFILNVDMDGIVEENTSFLARYSGAGAFLWGHKLAGSEFASVDVFVDGGTEVINWAVAGIDQATSPSDLDPGTAFVHPVPSAGSDVMHFIAIVQFTSDGDYMWSTVEAAEHASAGTNPPDPSLWDFTTDADGNIYIAGSIHDDYSIYADNQTSISNYPFGRDGFVLKYSSSGALLWEKVVGGTPYTNSEAVTDVTLDANGNIWLVTVLSTDAELNLGGPSVNVGTLQLGDIVVIQYDPNGNHLWHGVVGGDWHDSGSRIGFWNGDAVLCGSYGTFGGTADLDITAGVQSFTAIDIYDAFITRFTPSITTAIANDPTIDVEMMVWPNPATDLVHVDAGIGAFEVFDALGQHMIEKRRGKLIDVSTWADGLYFIKSDDGTHQLIVQH
jgi:Secretion system C-terminal sorting domain